MNTSLSTKRNMKFSMILKSLMKNMNISAKALAEKTSIPRTTISEWLGDRTPKLSEDIIRLSDFFNVSLDYMLTGKSATLQNKYKNIMIHQGHFKITIQRLSRLDTDDESES